MLVTTMNNTRTLTIAAIFIAATLVAGATFAATTAQSASAYLQKKDDKRDDKKDGGNGNGNTVTAQINKQKASQSGWDNTQEQEAQNTICTHPSTNCVSENEGAAGAGVCSSPLVLAHVGSTTGFVICVDPSDLEEPNPGGQCGSGVDVFIDSTHLCIPKKS
jgi:opacity protein-like surface antigen